MYPSPDFAIVFPPSLPRGMRDSASWEAQSPSSRVSRPSSTFLVLLLRPSAPVGSTKAAGLACRRRTGGHEKRGRRAPMTALLVVVPLPSETGAVDLLFAVSVGWAYGTGGSEAGGCRLRQKNLVYVNRASGLRLYSEFHVSRTENVFGCGWVHKIDQVRSTQRQCIIRHQCFGNKT